VFNQVYLVREFFVFHRGVEVEVEVRSIRQDDQGLPNEGVNRKRAVRVVDLEGRLAIYEIGVKTTVYAEVLPAVFAVQDTRVNNVR